jgi:hypothetical protein
VGKRKNLNVTIVRASRKPIPLALSGFCLQFVKTVFLSDCSYTIRFMVKKILIPDTGGSQDGAAA